MNFGKAITLYWTNYANFKGRTSRAAFWWAVLFTALASMAVSIIFPDQHMTLMMDPNNWIDDQELWQSSPAQNLWSLATFIPSLALLVRRLHDTGRSGHWAWLMLAIFVGWIVLLAFTVQEGSKSKNIFGEVPVE